MENIHHCCHYIFEQFELKTVKLCALLASKKQFISPGLCCSFNDGIGRMLLELQVHHFQSFSQWVATSDIYF